MSNSPLPQFSIIIPTHLRPKLLERALHSIKVLNDSSLSEVIVVSDCPDFNTDTTCFNLLSKDDTYIRRSGQPGPSLSRNLALSLARGENIIFLDDDDTLLPNSLNLLTKCDYLIRRIPVYFNCKVIKESRTEHGPIFIDETSIDLKDRLNNNIYIKNQIPICCYALPRHFITNLKFDHHMRAYEDWDFVLSFLKLIQPIHVPIYGACIHEVSDETSDRRGSQTQAIDKNAILDYLYVYRRHNVSDELKIKRSELLSSVGLDFDYEFL